MRINLALLALPLLSLAACGGAGVNTLGSVAPPGGTTADPGTGGDDGPAHFLDVSSETSFDAVGSLQSITIADDGAQLYEGDAGTPDSPSGTITYNPRDGVFEVALSDSRAGVSRDVRFQDPAHRTDSAPGVAPAQEVPDYAGFNYLTSLDGSGPSTFFYQRPGKTTKYVSLAGFVHIDQDADTGALTHAEHGVMVFGDPTTALKVPVTGSGHYDGDFIATMINQKSFDTGGSAPVFQWMKGTSSVDVDFDQSSVALALAGVVGQGFVGNEAVDDQALNIPSGSTFTAAATATITALENSFSGKFSSAAFGVAGTAVPIDFSAVNPGNSTAGASSVDGQFYGADASELGGSFRVVGGVPDQRVDIHGAFTGAKR